MSRSGAQGGAAAGGSWQVWGCYRDELLDGHALALRSRLEIFRTPMPPEAAIAGVPDVVAVMMNPGGSRPLGAPDRRGWCVAMPDRTQYQLMRLADRVSAHGVNWRHLRVVNLSDIRTPRSAELFEWFARLSDRRHSLFAPERRAECLGALGPGAVPVIAAWGLGVRLRPWAAAALESLRGRVVLGLTDDETLYRHPLPQRFDLQQAWLESMVARVVAAGLSSPGLSPTR